MSSIGISVGGTAGIMSLIAALGGPLVFVAGLAVLIALGLKAIFGKSWRRRLAEQVCEELNKRDILGELCGGLWKFWEETNEGLSQVVASFEDAYEKWIEEMERLLKTNDPETLRMMLKKCEEYQCFFTELPWKPLNSN